MNQNVFRIARILCAVALVSALVTGCSGSKPPAERIIGTWSIDTEAMQAALQAQVGAAAEGTGLEAMGAQMAAAMIPMLAAATFTWEEGGTVVMSMMGQSRTGQYEVVSTEGESITLRMTDADGGDPDEATFTFDGNDRMSADMDDMPMVFVRAN
jgi:hypothetical protein